MKISNEDEREERFKRIERNIEIARAIHAETARMNAETMKEPKYSPETILRYRALMRESYFDRKIVASVPSDLEHDELTLECGHTRWTFAGYERKQDQCVYCEECVQAWLKENS